jgi:CheY-like chemotaxis protein
VLRKTRDSAAAAAMDIEDDGSEGEIEAVALDALVERVVAACMEKPAGQKGGESRIAFDCKLEKGVEIQGEERRLRVMLAHLVRNAMNAIPRRGKVSVTVRQQDGEAVVSVQDDGLGVTEAVRQRLIDPSSAVDHPDGRASGYAVIHEVLARHGGRIEIESRKGIGTTVRAIFPSAKAAAGAERRRRVLVVDDDPMVREVISTYLNEDGYTVELAVNGREALEKFCAGSFDIVLTDRSMPEMGGDEFAREVKKKNAAVPVILLTGFGDVMAAAGEKPEGVDFVMNKPFTMAGLHNTLAQFR